MAEMMTIEDECAPFIYPEDNSFPCSGIYCWNNVAGQSGYHAFLRDSSNCFTFGLGWIEWSTDYERSMIEKSLTTSMGIIAGIKEISEYISQENDQDLIQDFNVNDVRSWIPYGGKFASVQHFGAVNFFLGLYLQRDAKELHNVQCAVCSVSGEKIMFGNPNDLLTHSRMEHVHVTVPEILIRLSICPKDKLQNMRNGSNFLKAMTDVIEKARKQVVLHYPL